MKYTLCITQLLITEIPFLPYLKEVTLQSPGMVGALATLEASCQALYHQRRFQEVEAAYTTLLEEGVDKETRAVVYNNRGHARYMQVDFPGALQDLEAALELAPGLAAAHYTWATVTYRLGGYSKALPAFQRAVELEPGNREFQEGLAGCRGLTHTSA